MNFGRLLDVLSFLDFLRITAQKGGRCRPKKKKQAPALGYGESLGGSEVKSYFFWVKHFHSFDPLLFQKPQKTKH